MAAFKPSLPYAVPVELLIPEYSTKKGVKQKTYPVDGIRINCSFRTYGGTELVNDGVMSVSDTAIVETWYRPDISAECAIRLMETGEVYEVIGHPEDIEKRHQFCRFKVRAIEGNG